MTPKPPANRPALLLWLLAAANLLVTGCSFGGFGPQGKAPLSAKPRVLVVGDSLTVGGFGDALEWAFSQAFGADKVAVYGCGGASVEHLLQDEPVFTCRCGYRETTAQRRTIETYEGGRRPRPVPAPKLADLLRRHQPEVVVVQMGTNNFDTLLKGGQGAVPAQAEYFERFADELVRTTGSVRRVVWVTPPDSSKFPPAVETAVESMIMQASRKRGIHVIRSRQYTKYEPGTTGGDGVHYAAKPAREWATKVISELNRILPPVQGGGVSRTAGTVAVPAR